MYFLKIVDFIVIPTCSIGLYFGEYKHVFICPKNPELILDGAYPSPLNKII